MKKLILLSLLLTNCGGGGTDHDFSGNIGCHKDVPLLCEETETCCPRGSPYFCDGFCYPFHQDTCVQEDVCTFDTVKKIDVVPEK